MVSNGVAPDDDRTRPGQQQCVRAPDRRTCWARSCSDVVGRAEEVIRSGLRSARHGIGICVLRFGRRQVRRHEQTDVLLRPSVVGSTERVVTVRQHHVGRERQRRHQDAGQRHADEQLGQGHPGVAWRCRTGCFLKNCMSRNRPFRGLDIVLDHSNCLMNLAGRAVDGDGHSLDQHRRTSFHPGSRRVTTNPACSPAPSSPAW